MIANETKRTWDGLINTMLRPMFFYYPRLRKWASYVSCYVCMHVRRLAYHKTIEKIYGLSMARRDELFSRGCCSCNYWISLLCADWVWNLSFRPTNTNSNTYRINSCNVTFYNVEINYCRQHFIKSRAVRFNSWCCYGKIVNSIFAFTRAHIKLLYFHATDGGIIYHCIT